jgi:hypothetical protein
VAVANLVAPARSIGCARDRQASESLIGGDRPPALLRAASGPGGTDGEDPGAGASGGFVTGLSGLRVAVCRGHTAPCRNARLPEYGERARRRASAVRRRLVLRPMAKTLFKPVQYELSQLLGDIVLGKLALPELQRPFVWDKVAVRDLLDSMYRGFPVGYLMLWNAAEVDAKFIGIDGKQHTPTEFIIDGQQRLTSLYAVMKGAEVTFKDFSHGRIRLAFRPRDGRFEVADAATEKDPEFLSSITDLWTGEDWEVIDAFVERLRSANPEALAQGRDKIIRGALGRLSGLEDFPFLAVQIGHEVDEERVADIFLRVNSGGTTLTQADFILTLLSVFREDDRRRLERFAKESRIVPADGAPSPYNHLVSPSADQLLRVGVLVGFQRGRLQSVLSLLRGGSVDGDTTLTESDRNAQLDKLTAAIDQSLDLTSWHEYIKTLMSAGFRRSTEISSENNVVLVYALYLIGREYGLSHSELRTTIARYFFMSSLTGRYTGSFEAQITQDVQAFTTDVTDGAEYLARLRQAIVTTLTNDYWTITLPQALATSAARGPSLFAYAASLCLLNARVPPFVDEGVDHEQKAALFLRDLFDPVLVPKKAPVERHHLFPRKYLDKIGITGTRNVNQIANLSYVEWPENINISDNPPHDYWPRYAERFTPDDLFHHALPESWDTMTYETFLGERRKMIAAVVRKGFESIGASPPQQNVVDGPPLVPSKLTDTYLHPDRPFSNELAIRRVIRQLQGSVLWYEQHMDRKALEILTDDLRIDEIDEVHLLSGPANLSSKAKRAFERFSEELESRGVAADWRVLPADRARALHARVIADDTQTFEVPPLNSVLAGTVDSIRTSDMPLDAFRQAWSHGVPLEDFQTDS